MTFQHYHRNPLPTPVAGLCFPLNNFGIVNNIVSIDIEKQGMFNN